MQCYWQKRSSNMSPLFGTFGDASARSFGLTQFLISIITDAWARTTSGGLGTSPIGNVWTNLSGVWTTNSNALATTATAASSYPLATTPFKVQSTMQATTVSQGAGIAFWVTSAGNWWAVVETNTSGSVISGYYCSSSACSSAVCNGFTSSCNGYTCVCTGGYVAASKYSSGGCAGYSSVCGGTSSVCAGTSCTGYSCTGYSPSYATMYYWAVNFLQSVSSVVSTIAANLLQQSSSSSTSNLINSLQVVTTPGTSNNVVITAFSDTSNVTSLGSVTVSGTSPAGSVSAGIILSPTTFNQGSTIGAINYI